MSTSLRARGALAALVLLLSTAAATAMAQETTWVETRFHRIHLLNGNFIDGHVTRMTNSEIILALPVGEMIIRKNTIDRVELMKMRSLLEKPQFEPSIRKAPAASSRPDAPAVKSDVKFEAAPAKPEIVESVAALFAQLKSASPEKKGDIVEQMSRMDQAGPYLASVLPTLDEGTADLVRSVLLRSKDTEMVPYLVKALDSDKPYVRVNALQVLGVVGGPDQAGTVRSYLNDRNSAVRSTAIDTLRQVGDASTVNEVADLVGEEDDAVRISAINTSLELGRAHSKMEVVAEAMRRALNGSQGKVAKDLLSAVSRAKFTELWPTVVPFLRDVDPVVRKGAAVTLQTLEAPGSAEALINGLQQEDDPLILVEFVRATAKTKSLTTVAPLIRLLSHSNGDVLNAVSLALTNLTGQKFGVDQAKWLEWSERNSGK